MSFNSVCVFWIRITSVTEYLPVSLVFRWILFLWTNHEGFFACHSCHAYLAYLLLKDCVWLHWDPLQPHWVNQTLRTHTHCLTKAWKESDEGLCWQAEEAAAAPGRVQSHRSLKGGGGRERKFKILIYQSYKSRLVTTDIHHSDRQTDRQSDRPQRKMDCLVCYISEQQSTIHSVLLKEQQHCRGALAEERPHEVKDIVSSTTATNHEKV